MGGMNKGHKGTGTDQFPILNSQFSSDENWELRIGLFLCLCVFYLLNNVVVRVNHVLIECGKKTIDGKQQRVPVKTGSELR